MNDTPFPRAPFCIILHVVVHSPERVWFSQGPPHQRRRSGLRRALVRPVGGNLLRQSLRVKDPGCCCFHLLPLLVLLFYGVENIRVHNITLPGTTARVRPKGISASSCNGCWFGAWRVLFRLPSSPDSVRTEAKHGGADLARCCGMLLPSSGVCNRFGFGFGTVIIWSVLVRYVI